MANFSLALPHILRAEGGATVTNTRGDRRGWTKYGITQFTLSEWRGVTCGEPEIRALSSDEAGRIYKAMYWDRCRLDEVTSTKKAQCIMDQAVNRGVSTVIAQVQILCRSLGKASLNVDGVVDGTLNGSRTIIALNQLSEIAFCREFLQASRIAYASICVSNPDQLRFLRGWLNRVHAVEQLVWKDSR